MEFKSAGRSKRPLFDPKSPKVRPIGNIPAGRYLLTGPVIKSRLHDNKARWYAIGVYATLDRRIGKGHLYDRLNDLITKMPFLGIYNYVVGKDGILYIYANRNKDLENYFGTSMGVETVFRKDIWTRPTEIPPIAIDDDTGYISIYDNHVLAVPHENREIIDQLFGIEVIKEREREDTEKGKEEKRDLTPKLQDKLLDVGERVVNISKVKSPAKIRDVVKFIKKNDLCLAVFTATRVTSLEGEFHKLFGHQYEDTIKPTTSETPSTEIKVNVSIVVVHGLSNKHVFKEGIYTLKKFPVLGFTKYIGHIINVSRWQTTLRFSGEVTDGNLINQTNVGYARYILSEYLRAHKISKKTNLPYKIDYKELARRKDLYIDTPQQKEKSKSPYTYENEYYDLESEDTEIPKDILDRLMGDEEDEEYEIEEEKNEREDEKYSSLIEEIEMRNKFSIDYNELGGSDQPPKEISVESHDSLESDEIDEDELNQLEFPFGEKRKLLLKKKLEKQPPEAFLSEIVSAGFKTRIDGGVDLILSIKDSETNEIESVRFATIGNVSTWLGDGIKYEINKVVLDDAVQSIVRQIPFIGEEITVSDIIVPSRGLPFGNSSDETPPNISEMGEEAADSSMKYYLYEIDTDMILKLFHEAYSAL